MRHPRWISAIAIVAVGSACAHRPPDGAAAAPPESGVTFRQRTEDEPEALSVKAMMELLEASPRAYTFKSAERGELDPDATLAQLFPESVTPTAYPQVTTAGGQRSIRPWPMKAEANDLLERAEPFYRKEDFARAADIAAEAARIDPENYWVWLYLGDCSLFGGDSEKALAQYDRAAALNPYDYRVHFFRGSALVRLGRLAEARLSFARSLALKPRNPALVDRIRKDERLDFTVGPDLFRPRAEVTPDTNGFQIRAEVGAAHWFAYGACKAMWLGEPEHRQRMTGGTNPSFTSTEEQECLTALFTVYLSERKKKATSSDEGLDALAAALKAGFASEFILYEFASRVHPQVVLTLPDQMRDRMVQFVDQHLFVPRREESEPPGPKPQGSGRGDEYVRR